MEKIRHERPITLYDTVKKCPIGIFSTPSLAARYIYDKWHEKKTKNICHAANKNGKLLKNKFPFAVACRYSSNHHIEVLADDAYYIFEGYPNAKESRMKGFTDNACSLARKGNEKNAKVWNDHKRIKNNELEQLNS